MNKNKRILISLLLALLLLIIFNIVYNKYSKSNNVEAYVLIEDVVKGEKIDKEKLKKVDIPKEISSLDIIEKIDNVYYARTGIKKGQILTKECILLSEENVQENLEIVAIPITTSDDAVGYKIKKGNVVNIYFTGKTKQVTGVLNSEKQLVYSSEDLEGIVTTKLYENIEVANVYDSVGSNNALFTQILIMVDKEDAVKLINLKQLGTFTLTLKE